MRFDPGDFFVAIHPQGKPALPDYESDRTHGQRLIGKGISRGQFGISAPGFPDDSNRCGLTTQLLVGGPDGEDQTPLPKQGAISKPQGVF